MYQNWFANHITFVVLYSYINKNVSLFAVGWHWHKTWCILLVMFYQTFNVSQFYLWLLKNSSFALAIRICNSTGPLVNTAGSYVYSLYNWPLYMILVKRYFFMSIIFRKLNSDRTLLSFCFMALLPYHILQQNLRNFINLLLKIDIKCNFQWLIYLPTKNSYNKFSTLHCYRYWLR